MVKDLVNEKSNGKEYKEGWEEGFETLWQNFEDENAYGYPEMQEKVQDFISNLLSTQKQEIIRICESFWQNYDKDSGIEFTIHGTMRINGVVMDEKNPQLAKNLREGYNQALSDILEKI